MGKMKDYMMGLQEDFGPLVEQVISLLAAFPDLVKAKAFEKAIVDNKTVDSALTEAYDEIFIEMCNILQPGSGQDAMTVLGWAREAEDGSIPDTDFSI